VVEKVLLKASKHPKIAKPSLGNKGHIYDTARNKALSWRK